MTWTTLLLGATLAFGPATIHAIDPLNYVDLFIGTTLGGHTFPGNFYANVIPSLFSYSVFSLFRGHSTSWHGESGNGHGLVRQCKLLTRDSTT